MAEKLKPSASDQHRAFEFAAQLAGCAERRELNSLIRALPDLVGAESVVFAGSLQIDRAGGGGLSMAAESSDPSIYDPQVIARIGPLWRQQPVIVRQLRGLVPRPEKISDFVSAGKWRRREVYDQVYRPMGLSHELATHFSWTAGRVECAALHRAGRDFGERDRELLELVTPHLRAARERVEVHERFAARIELIERGFAALGDDLIVVDREGAVKAAGSGALTTLRSWFAGADGATRLPTEVSEWLTSERDAAEPQPLVRARGTRTVRLCLVHAREESLIAIEERKREPPSPAGLAASLPLTQRQAEVLALIAGGRTDAQIAIELGVSPHTARRHVEQVYARLGVNNRAAATAAALAAVSAAE